MEDIFDGVAVGDSVASEEGYGVGQGPAVVVYAHVGEGVESEDDGAILLQKCGLRFGDGSVVVAQHLTVGGPAFGVSAVIQKRAYGIWILAGEVGGLVQMTGISFMGKGREQGQIVGQMSLIDVDDVVFGVVDGWNHIESRTKILFHGFLDVFDLRIHLWWLRKVFPQFGF